MNVSSLQQFLDQVGVLARAAGASDKVGTEIERLGRCLQPFGQKSLSEFADFLQKAEEYDRTGTLTPPPTAKKARQPKAPAMTIDEAVTHFNALYERATDPTLDFAAIDAAFTRFEPLKAGDLKVIAQRVNVSLPSKATKPQILTVLKQRVTGRKSSFEGTQFRPGETSPT